MEHVARKKADQAKGSKKSNDTHIDVKGGEDANDPPHIEILQRNRTVAIMLLQENTGNKKARDEKENPDTIVAQMPEQAVEEMIPVRVDRVGNHYHQNAEGAHAIERWNPRGKH